MERRGYRPSYQQIAKHFGIKSKATVAKHITLLEKLGLIRRQRINGSFYIEILTSPKTLEENLCRIEWLVEDNQPLLISRSLLKTKIDLLYAYRMPDDSMNEAFIMPGDLVLLERTSENPKNADIVLVNFEGSLLLRRIFFTNQAIELKPENKSLKSIFTTNLKIEGVMRLLLRSV